MANLNRVLLIGNLTRDPEVRYTPKGVPVAELSLAINRYIQTEGGEKKEEVTFVDVTLWARMAEISGEYLKKGKPVFIEGVCTWIPGTINRPDRSDPGCGSSQNRCSCWEQETTAIGPPIDHREPQWALFLLNLPANAVRISMLSRTISRFKTVCPARD